MRDIRLQDMEKVIRGAGTISMEALCDRFQVSMHTVRRDVAELERRGVAHKIYGGVTALEKNVHSLISFDERAIVHEKEKRECCRVAAELVEDGDVIFIDSGTTVPAMVDFLSRKNGITIITNNLDVILRAMPYDNLDVIVLPGRLRRKTHSMTGSQTISGLRGYNIRKAFMATTGTTENMVTNSSPNEFEVKQTAMATIPERILMLTSDKFGHAGLMNYASFGDFQAIVTDCVPEEPFRSALAGCGARIFYASEIREEKITE